MSDVNLTALLREVVAENYSDFEAHSIALDIDMPDEDIITTGDFIELKRALTNLIVNIYRHNPDGINARISVKRKTEKIYIKISDAGTVIPNGMNIFEPFVTENSARTTSHGTGLGLAMAERIVEQHGGNLILETQDPPYTKTFVIILNALDKHE